MILEKANRKNGGEDVVIYRVEGRLKLGESAQFFESAIIHEDTARILVDFNRIDYVDSTGLGELVGYCNKLVRSGKKMVFIAGALRIKQLFAILHMEPLLFEDEKKALAALQN